MRGGGAECATIRRRQRPRCRRTRRRRWRRGRHRLHAGLPRLDERGDQRREEGDVRAALVAVGFTPEILPPPEALRGGGSRSSLRAAPPRHDRGRGMLATWGRASSPPRRHRHRLRGRATRAARTCARRRVGGVGGVRRRASSCVISGRRALSFGANRSEGSSGLVRLRTRRSLSVSSCCAREYDPTRELRHAAHAHRHRRRRALLVRRAGPGRPRPGGAAATPTASTCAATA